VLYVVFFSPQRSQRDTEDLAPWISVLSVVFFSPQRSQRDTEDLAPWISVFSVVSVFFTTEVTEGHRGFSSVDLRVLRGECFFHHRGHRGAQRI